MRTYLPSIHPTAPVSGQADEAAELTRLWLLLLGRRANSLRQDARLVRCAADHALYLDSRTGDALRQSMHIGRGNTTANERVRLAGLRLPDYWPERGNQCESCCRTHRGAARALELFIESPPHHDHLLVTGWFSEHILWGIGAAGHDYVFVSVPES